MQIIAFASYFICLNEKNKHFKNYKIKMRKESSSKLSIYLQININITIN